MSNYEIKPWQVVFVAVSIPAHFMNEIHPAFGLICHLSSSLIYAYIFYIAWSTSSNDLIAARCQFRLWFMSGAATAGVLFSTLHWIYGDYGLAEWIIVFEGITLLALTMIFAYWAAEGS